MKARVRKALNAGLPASMMTVLRNRRAPARPLPAPSPAAGIRVASYNIHKCVGADRRFDPCRIRRVIHEIGADIIALQEADRRLGDRNGLLDLPWLEAETGLIPVPVAGIRKAHGWHGNLVLIRRGLAERLDRIEQIALPGLEPRGAIVADLNLGPGRSLRVIATHFGLLRHSRTRQTERLSEFMEPDGGRPALLMGDLNEWRTDDRSGLGPLDRRLGPLPSPPPSFPSRWPLLALDRIIATHGDILSPTAVHDTPLARMASDHLPVTAALTLPRVAARPDPVDHQET